MMLLYNGWELRLRLENNSGGQVQPEADPPLAETCLRLRRVVDSSSGARLPAGAVFGEGGLWTAVIDTFLLLS